jgi:hypothetical protein
MKFGAEEVVKTIAKFAQPGSDIEITLLSGERIGYTVLDQMSGHHWRNHSRLREYSPQYREEVLRRWSE